LTNRLALPTPLPSSRTRRLASLGTEITNRGPLAQAASALRPKTGMPGSRSVTPEPGQPAARAGGPARRTKAAKATNGTHFDGISFDGINFDARISHLSIHSHLKPHVHPCNPQRLASLRRALAARDSNPFDFASASTAPRAARPAAPLPVARSTSARASRVSRAR